jgi:hypothetical protein
VAAAQSMLSYDPKSAVAEAYRVSLTILSTTMSPKRPNLKAIGLHLVEQEKPTAPRADHPVRHLAANEGFFSSADRISATESRPAAPAFR